MITKDDFKQMQKQQMLKLMFVYPISDRDMHVLKRVYKYTGADDKYLLVTFKNSGYSNVVEFEAQEIDKAHMHALMRLYITKVQVLRADNVYTATLINKYSSMSCEIGEDFKPKYGKQLNKLFKNMAHVLLFMMKDVRIQ